MTQPTDRWSVAPESLNQARNDVREMLDLIRAYGGTLGDVLDVGCDVGLHVHALGEAGARSVTGIDIPAYGARQAENRTAAAQSQILSERRKEVGKAFGLTSGDISFRDVDVAELDDEESYDLITSWETLEHVSDPSKAFDRMHAALKPGGLAFHKYNPFFAIDGGHSLCTLDFDWGHLRLDESGFRDYLQRYRPSEAGLALEFYKRSLNRMALSDLEHHVDSSGMDLLALVPWADRVLLQAIDREVVHQVSHNYPAATVVDLISARVWLILRRPA
jgi:SAM-dependent methyltransferase